mmetsp:Transcript_55663/g.82424  ORF Transcript_55663/g.82424 Transcript_55663/m.82424 type:complete len:100 (-) Transcript_55663:335-634(-)
MDPRFRTRTGPFSLNHAMVRENSDLEDAAAAAAAAALGLRLIDGVELATTADGEEEETAAADGKDLKGFGVAPVGPRAAVESLGMDARLRKWMGGFFRR